MPILEVPPAGLDLAQGDILANLTLFAGGDAEAVRIPETHALVLSRDCTAVRDRFLTVAPVQSFTTPPKGMSPDELAQFFAELRDGDAEPDRLYLGSLSPEPEAPRYKAHLDRLCLVRTPTQERRAAWVVENRIARLTADFVRALPVRLFQATARVGFDEYGWYSTTDLQWLMLVVDGEVARLGADLAAKKVALATAQAAANKGAADSAQKEVRKAEDALLKFTTKFQPYRDELKRRADAAAGAPR